MPFQLPERVLSFLPLREYSCALRAESFEEGGCHGMQSDGWASH